MTGGTQADVTHRPEELPVSPALKTVIYPVKDLAHAKTLYAAPRPRLGLDPIMDEAYCIQFTTADREPGLDPNGHSKGRTGPVSYWHVADIKDSCPAPTGRGNRATARQRPRRQAHRRFDGCGWQRDRAHPDTRTGLARPSGSALWCEQLQCDVVGVAKFQDVPGADVLDLLVGDTALVEHRARRVQI